MATRIWHAWTVELSHMSEPRCPGSTVAASGFVNQQSPTMPRRLTLSKGRAAMTPDQLRGAARNLAYGLGIPVYIRDGRIYQDGPGRAFLPPNGDPAEAPFDHKEEVDAANESITVPKAIGILLMMTPTLWLAWQL